VLGKRPEVDANRIGALGEDLGGDLVIRAASTSKEIKAVAALAPILADVPAGLDLLHEMTYFRALRWARDRKRANLRKELNAVEYEARIPPRPFLLLYGEQDRLVGDPWSLLHPPKGSPSAGRPPVTQDDPLRQAWIQAQVIPGAGHFHLAEQPMALQVISQWLKEHL
jgi:pimeloyl-ACP methyl ester carboxylesterase